MASFRVLPRLLLLATAFTSTMVFANRYTLVDLGDATCAVAVNRAGDVAGDNVGSYHPGVYRGGRWHLLSAKSDVAAINRSGDTAGWHYVHNGPIVGMVWPHNGEPITITFGSSSVWAYGINDNETAVGYFQTAGQLDQCFVWTPDSGFTHLYSDQFQRCDAMAVNNFGQVTGLATYTSWGNAFLWSNGRFVNLGTPDGTLATYGLALNDKSQVVGWALVDELQDTEAAFLWDGSMHNLDPEQHYYESEATSINNSGQIVGWAKKGYDSYLMAVRFAHSDIIHLDREVTNLGYWRLEMATSINDKGVIVGCGLNAGQGRAFMLVPDKTE